MYVNKGNGCAEDFSLSTKLEEQVLMRVIYIFGFELGVAAWEFELHL